VAETSLTIDGVRVVIDAGLAKIARFDPYRSINTLLIERISRASADQRAGRAGRTAPGICMRLWTEREHLDRPAQELPEVRRLDLSEVVLTLKASGVRDVSAFRWLERPDAKSLERALTLLTDLGALDHESELTVLGQRMLAFPAHPRYARMLLAAHAAGCVPDVAKFCQALTASNGDELPTHSFLAAIAISLVGMATFLNVFSTERIVYWREASTLPQPAQTVAYFVGKDLAMLPQMAVGPLLFGLLPPGLTYHLGYSVLAAITMALLVRFAWPSHLEDEASDDQQPPTKKP
jgi:HrpA-like RNA helicase